MNKKFTFPKQSESNNDSLSTESSMSSLKGVTYYDLQKQNENRELDATDQLVELLYGIRSLEKQELYFHFK